MKRDLPIGVTELRAELVAVNLGQLERGLVPQPEEHRQLRLAGVLSELAGGLDVGLLEHVRVVDPARQASAEPEVDHPKKVFAAHLEEGVQRFVVPGGRPPELFQVIAFRLNTRVAHTLSWLRRKGPSATSPGFTTRPECFNPSPPGKIAALNLCIHSYQAPCNACISSGEGMGPPSVGSR